MTVKHTLIAWLLAIMAPSAVMAQDQAQLTQDAQGRIPAGSRVYIGPIEGGYDIYLAAAMHKKEVPIIIVTDKSKADFELSGVSESEKAGWAKVVNKEEKVTDLLAHMQDWTVKDLKSRGISVKG